MAALSKCRLSTLNVRPVPAAERRKRRSLPRRCMFVFATLLLSGLVLPLLMAVDWLPSNLPLAFAGWALVATGGTLLLTRCGEL